MQFTLGDLDAGLAAKHESVKFTEFCVLLIKLAMLDQLTDRGDSQRGLGITFIGLSMITELDVAKLGNRFALHEVGSHVSALGDLQQPSVVDPGGFTNNADLAFAMLASEGLNLFKRFADLVAVILTLSGNHCVVTLHGPVKQVASNVEGDINDSKGRF